MGHCLRLRHKAVRIEDLRIRINVLVAKNGPIRRNVGVELQLIVQVVPYVSDDLKDGQNQSRRTTQNHTKDPSGMRIPQKTSSCIVRCARSAKSAVTN